MKPDKQFTSNSSLLANERSLKKDIEFFYAKRKQKFSMLLTKRTINSFSLNISKNKQKKWIFRSLEPQQMSRFEWLSKYKDFLKKKKSSTLFIITFTFNFLLRFLREYKLIFEILVLFFFFSGLWLNFLN